MRARLPPRLATLVDTDLQSARDSSATLPIDDAEALIFEIDSTLGDGSGRTLEEAGRSLAARTLTEGGVVAFHSPVEAARLLETHLLQAFENASVLFDLSASEEGFTLTIGVGGRPRSARALRHFAVGYLRAAATGAGPLGATLKLYSEIVGDRANITAIYGETESPVDISAVHVSGQASGPVSKRRYSSTLRAVQPGGLTAEVERILASASIPPKPTEAAASEAPADGEDRLSEERPTTEASTSEAAGRVSSSGGGRNPA